MPASGEAALVRRRGPGRSAVPARRGGGSISELQRSRMLSSAVTVISEHGYAQLSVARITGLAGVSRRTFYDLFEDREDCFLAVFEDTVARVGGLLAAGYASEQSWKEQVRSALAALLWFLDKEPGAGRLLILDALTAGPRVLAYRAEILRQLSGSLHRGACAASRSRVLPPLTGEGVVGALFGVMHARLLAPERKPMLSLLNPLMGMILLPYQGPAAAQRELARPAPRLAKIIRETQRERSSHGQDSWNAISSLPMRITYRTLRVLKALAERPGSSNREVADRAGVTDQGQISKLLWRLERLELIENAKCGQPSGEANVWRLTPRGEEVQRTVPAQTPNANHNDEASGTMERQ